MQAGKKADAYYLWSESAFEEWWKYCETTIGANLKNFSLKVSIFEGLLRPTVFFRGEKGKHGK